MVKLMRLLLGKHQQAALARDITQKSMTKLEDPKAKAVDGKHLRLMEGGYNYKVALARSIKSKGMKYTPELLYDPKREEFSFHRKAFVPEIKRRPESLYFYGMGKQGNHPCSDLVRRSVEDFRHFVPLSVNFFNDMMLLNVDSDFPLEAIRTYRTMVSGGITTDFRTLDLLAHSFFRASEFDYAWAVTAKMIQRGFAPDPLTYLKMRDWSI